MFLFTFRIQIRCVPIPPRRSCRWKVQAPYEIGTWCMMSFCWRKSGPVGIGLIFICIYICIWYMYACLLQIVGKHDWLFLQLICCYFVNATDLRCFFMLTRLFAMNSCTAVESLDWSLEVHDATYAKLLSIGPNLFFRPVQKKASPWCLWEPLKKHHWSDQFHPNPTTIHFLFGKEPSFWSFYYVRCISYSR